jgi:GNAT superfamily N-acetyltransferase
VTGSSEPPISEAGAADLDALQALVAAAGWNQTAADWRLFLEHGAVWCIRDAIGRAIASAALLPYPPATAWISMVLTDPQARGRGHGTRLFAHAVGVAQAMGLAPQLDATPAGRPIYEALGFRPLCDLQRWRLAGTDTAVAPPATANTDVALAWDRRALGFARAAIVEALLDRGPAVVRASGMVLSRDGRKARQLGPIVAADEAEAVRLLEEALALIGPASVVVDALDDRPGLRQALQAAGFLAERPFTRMAKGAVPAGDRALLHAIAGPELG